MLIKTKRAKLYPHKLTGCYYVPERKEESDQDKIDKLVRRYTIGSKPTNFQSNTHHGYLSSAAKSKVTAAIHALRIISDWKWVYVKDTKKIWKFRMTFITLTIPYPQIHPDKLIMIECFLPMLKYLTYQTKMNSYVWKAEAQSNGDLHFHITTNVFIHYKKVQNKWNQLLNKLGYTDRYFKETGESDPPSTQIKAVKNDNRLASYIAGELTKKDNNKNHCSLMCPIDNGYYTRKSYNQNINADKSITESKRTVECRLWGSSTNLINNFETYINPVEGIIWELQGFKKEHFYKTIQHDYGFSCFFKFNAHNKLPEPFKTDMENMIKKIKQYEPPIKSYKIESLN